MILPNSISSFHFKCTNIFLNSMVAKVSLSVVFLYEKKMKRWITKKSFEGGDDILLEQYQISAFMLLKKKIGLRGQACSISIWILRMLTRRNAKNGPAYRVANCPLMLPFSHCCLSFYCYSAENRCAGLFFLFIKNDPFSALARVHVTLIEMTDLKKSHICEYEWLF